MAELILLGSASAVPDDTHENTHLVLRTEDRVVLVDAPGNPITRLEKAGIPPLQVTDLILTHFHPDHVSGVPLFLMVSWLLGRKDGLNIYGLEDTLNRMEAVMSLFGWSSWPGMFPCVFYHLPEEEYTEVLETPTLRISASPVKHLIPNIGLRFDLPKLKKSAAYSSDTEPSEAFIRLANNVHLLVHECSGETNGHSSAYQAGEIAEQVQAETLVLVHYPVSRADQQLPEAKKSFSGEVLLGEDFLRFPL